MQKPTALFLDHHYERTERYNGDDVLFRYFYKYTRARDIDGICEAAVFQKKAFAKALEKWQAHYDHDSCELSEFRSYVTWELMLRGRRNEDPTFFHVWKAWLRSELDLAEAKCDPGPSDWNDARFQEGELPESSEEEDEEEDTRLASRKRPRT
jgi:hypothetical protein